MQYCLSLLSFIEVIHKRNLSTMWNNIAKNVKYKMSSTLFIFFFVVKYVKRYIFIFLILIKKLTKKKSRIVCKKDLYIL